MKLAKPLPEVRGEGGEFGLGLVYVNALRFKVGEVVAYRRAALAPL